MLIAGMTSHDNDLRDSIIFMSRHQTRRNLLNSVEMLEIAA